MICSMYGQPESPGIIPRLVNDLFADVNNRSRPNCRSSVHLNYFEIYNERIIDLLQDGSTSSKPVYTFFHFLLLVRNRANIHC